MEDQDPETTQQRLQEFYEVDRVVQLVRNSPTEYQRIALQFPDDLLKDSFALAVLLRKLLEREVYVLADTTYGSTDVDEIAAEHINADLIIHYGRAGLARNARLPTIYVFGRVPIDTQDCWKRLEEILKANSDLRRWVLFYDVVYSHCIDELKKFINEFLEGNKEMEIVISSLQSQLGIIPPMASLNPISESTESETARITATTTKTTESTSFEVAGRKVSLTDGLSMHDYSILYIGEESTTLTQLMMTYNYCPFYSYNPIEKSVRQESMEVNRALKRRYFLVQKVKDAEIVGIVVATFGVAGYQHVIESLKRILKAAGKRVYTFVVGKVNVAKMSNFLEVDVFVIVASAENSFIDSKEYPKPIVTPFEVEIALVHGKQWGTEYSLNFQERLDILEEAVEVMENKEYDEDEEPEFSLLNQRYRPRRHIKPEYETTSADSSLGNDMKSMSIRNDSNQVAIRDNASVQFFKNRTFQGLDPQFGTTPITEATEGRSGIARGYSDEKSL